MHRSKLTQTVLSRILNCRRADRNSRRPRHATPLATLLLAGCLTGCHMPMAKSPHEHSYKPGWQDTQAHRMEQGSVPLTAIRGQSDGDLAVSNLSGPAHIGTATVPGRFPVSGAQLSTIQPNQTRWGDEGEGADGIARVSIASRAIPSGHTAPARFPSGPMMSGQFVGNPAPGNEIQAVSFSVAEPRMERDEFGQPIHTPAPGGVNGTAAQMYPDEYLLDGGDRDHPVHYSQFQREGLNTEDTISEYRDHLGKSHVQPSNSVAIYAPRFGAVRTVTAPEGETAIAKVGGVHDSVHDSGMKHRLGPDDYTLAAQPLGTRSRSRASGFESKSTQSGTENVAGLRSHQMLQNTFEDRAYAYQIQLQTTNEARLAEGINAATLWTRAENPVVVAQLDSTHQVKATFHAAGIVGTEDPRKEPGRLKIVKLADRSVAQPGDVITFTIRYDNLGEREVTDVQIVDNLTPRLEYIEDSASSDRAGDIVTQENLEGSLVLTFKLDEPLKEKTGGVITFQCRVR